MEQTLALQSLKCKERTKDLEGDGMINPEGSGTGAREMEKGKTLALQSLK